MKKKYKAISGKLQKHFECMFLAESRISRILAFIAFIATYRLHTMVLTRRLHLQKHSLQYSIMVFRMLLNNIQNFVSFSSRNHNINWFY